MAIALSLVGPREKGDAPQSRLTLRDAKENLALALLQSTAKTAVSMPNVTPFHFLLKMKRVTQAPTVTKHTAMDLQTLNVL